MTQYYRATFSNGKVFKRSSVSRNYTHAYQFISAGGYLQFGFSSSAAQAGLNLAAESAWSRNHNGPNKFEEVVAVEEITSKEYRAKEGKNELQT